MSTEPVIIHLYSGPRSLSTALMYSFAQRDDTEVLDEPLYAAWLNKNLSVFRPYRDELFQSQSANANEVLQKIFEKKGKRFIFLKHMGKQFSGTGVDRSVLYNARSKHVFLIRDPFEMITSWGKRIDVHQEECSLDNMCFLQLTELYSDLRIQAVNKPIVIDSDALKLAPEKIIKLLSAHLDLPFSEKQLSWPAGPKPDIDGIWAKYWYHTVHQTTGFKETNTNPTYKLLQGDDLELYREALPFYQLLKRKALGQDPLNPGSSEDPRLPAFAPTSTTSSDEVKVIDHGIPMTFGRSKLADPRNEHIIAWIGNGLVPRELAKVSAFDSAVQGGDAVWEGIRVYDQKVFKLNEHLGRLIDSAKAMGFHNIPTLEFTQQAIFKTLAANGMSNHAHMRLTLTRGPKITSSMNPQFNIFGCSLIILPEWKTVGDQTTYDNSKGIRLITATNRRNPPQCVDSKIHHNNLINNILPKIQANLAGAADALMLDLQGFVSETNATNVFMIKNGIVLTPTADACLPGITRKTVVQICKNIDLTIIERNISLAEFHAADEVFTTGTMGELTPVNEIDGRQIGDGSYPGPITTLIQTEYRKLTETEGTPLPFTFP